MTETKSKRKRPSFFGIFAGTFEVGRKNAKVMDDSNKRHMAGADFQFGESYKKEHTSTKSLR